MTLVRTVLFGAASLVVAACGDGGGFPDAPIDQGPPANGAFSVAWAVQDSVSTPITCDRVGGQSVTVILHEKGTQGGFTEAFTCGTGMGSASVPPGEYDLNFELRSATGILSTAPEQNPVVIKPNETTALAPLVFHVDATGSLDLAIATNTTGGNCADTASNGAGITGMTLTLETAVGATCQPVTFNVSAGASGTAGTYVVNCSSPTVTTCLNADQRLTTTAVPSGNYRIHVRGHKGAVTDCWTNDDVFAIPALGMTLTRTLNLAFQSSVPGCQ
ncbi:MAG: hypothetical protein SFX73_15785 [Kofleriaceae bacterium]|nr:hypothetical protein [Kofleriaceae bacterium]